MLFRGGFFSALPEIRSERMLIRRLTMRDAQDLFDVSSDPRVARYIMWYTHQSLGESRDFIRSITRNYRSDRPSPWGIELLSEKRVIGTIGYAWINRDFSSAEIGYSLGYPYWNQGLATEALHAVLTYGFYNMELNRIEAQHDIRNPASGRVMIKAGMQHEGTLRERIFSKNEYVTVDLYAATKKSFGLQYS